MAEANPYIKQYLMTAGPTPVPPRVAQVMAEPVLYHRAPAFVEVYERVLDRLPQVFRTTNQVLCFAASGTGAMESAVANLVDPRASPPSRSRPASSASAGASSATPTAPRRCVVDAEWGEKLDPARLDEALARPRAPGARRVRDPVGDLDRRRPRRPRPQRGRDARHGAVLCVDAVSGLGAVDLPQDEWGVDVVVSGSQKSLMCPPGLAFASVSERAMALAAENPGRRYYFDWARTAEGQAEDPPNSAFTPAVSLFRALDVALELIFDEGLDEVFARHAVLARGRARRHRGARPRALRPRRPERQRRHRGGASGRHRRARRCRS